ncbi:MAG: pyrimidine 5'-nucleotidase [Proteobacteria bacterium]|nr:pyrimidine 5'-nucleotidase [Pseudomonadota bacterium]
MAIALASIEAWVFDLDNTLYSTPLLYDAVGERMTAYIARALGVSDAEARILRERYFDDYGATVAGLSRHHALDAHDFLAHVHDVDYSMLDPDPELGVLIERLPGRKIVFTNGGGGHGQRALAQLAIAHCFELVFDIEAAGLAPKPQRAAYERLIEVCGIDPARSALIEDSARNLEPAHALGFATALIGAGDPRHAHFTAPDVKAFLRTVLSTLTSEAG